MSTEELLQQITDLRVDVERLQSLVDATPESVFLLTKDGTVVTCNRTAAERLGKTVQDLAGRCVFDLIPADVAAARRQRIEEVFRTGTPAHFQDIRGGTVFDNRVYPVFNESGAVTLVAGFARDVTRTKLVESSLDLAVKIIENSNEAIVVTDKHATILHVNDAFCRLTGYSRQELQGRTPGILKSGRHGPRFYEDMWRSLVSEGSWKGEIWDRRKNGEIYPKMLSINSVRDENEEVTHYVGFASDISEMKQTEERLQQMAHYDPLTGLANRVLFRERLNMAIAEAIREKRVAALMILDLDRFKNINDTLGHPVGDKLLVSVARRLKSCVRDSDTVCRLGGDEFTIVLPRLSGAREIPQVSRRLMEAFAKPFDLDGREVFISTSAGVTFAPTDGTEVDKLVQNADTALYTAKERGRNNFQFFSEQMNVELKERTELESALRIAIEDNNLNLHYHPIVDFEDGRIIAAEALLRWDHPKRGAIPPARVIPLAEDTGLIMPLGDWVLRTACAQNKSWQNMGLPPIHVSVNISGHQLSQPGFVRNVMGILAETALDPKWLILELTESVAVKDAETAINSFRMLRDSGVSVAIDDFGTGYSSLSYLKRFPIDKLKIDRSFVKDIASYSDNEPVLAAIVSVAHSLGLRVVAEGIETKKHVAFLWALNCDEWQGFYFSRPIPADAFTALHREGRRAFSMNLQWTPALAVHVDKIDGQHREWFRRVNEFCKNVASGRHDEGLLELVFFVEEYARFHFHDEETLMEEYDYPGYEIQKRAHRSFMDRFVGVRDSVVSGRVSEDYMVEIATDLFDWFVNHIEKLDRPLGDYLLPRMHKRN